MLESFVLYRTYQLTCFLLGLCSNILYSFMNLDLYDFLKYLGLSYHESHVVWYFLKRINLFLAVLVIAGTLLFASVSTSSLCRYIWLLFMLYTALASYLWFYGESGPRFNGTIQWILVCISIVSNVVQCESLFYAQHAYTGGGPRGRSIRLMLFLMGACLSIWIPKGSSFVHLSGCEVFFPGSRSTPVLIYKLMPMFCLLILFTAAVFTWLSYQLPDESGDNYPSYSVDGSTKYFSKYERWHLILLTAFGWAISPFCGILSTYISTKGRIGDIKHTVVIQHIIFVLIIMIAVAILRWLPVDRINDVDCDVNSLRNAVFAVLKARSETYDDEEEKVEMGWANQSEKMHLFKRVFRENQPWSLLPRGYWDRWIEFDYESNKWLTDYLVMYFLLLEAKLGTIKSTGTYGCANDSYTSVSERYSILKEVKDMFCWAINDFVGQYNRILRSFNREIQTNSSCSCCIFDKLETMWRSHSSCVDKKQVKICTNCIYKEPGLRRGCVQFMQGTILCCMEDVKSLDSDMKNCPLLTIPDKEVNNLLFKKAVDEIERILSAYLDLMLLCTIANEWLLLSRSLRYVHRELFLTISKEDVEWDWDEEREHDLQASSSVPTPPAKPAAPTEVKKGSELPSEQQKETVLTTVPTNDPVSTNGPKSKAAPTSEPKNEPVPSTKQPKKLEPTSEQQKDSKSTSEQTKDAAASTEPKKESESSEDTKDEPQKPHCKGCDLFTKMLGCASLIHKRQCEMIPHMSTSGFNVLKSRLPTMCHIRALRLLSTSYALYYNANFEPQNNGTGTTKNIWHCNSYNPQLEALIDDLMSDLESLSNGDQILGCAISLLSSNKKDLLKIPSIILEKLSPLKLNINKAVDTAIQSGWSLLNWLSVGFSYDYEKQRCECKDKDQCAKDNCCNKADCKYPKCQCIHCMADDPCEKINDIFKKCECNEAPDEEKRCFLTEAKLNPYELCLCEKDMKVWKCHGTSDESNCKDMITKCGDAVSKCSGCNNLIGSIASLTHMLSCTVYCFIKSNYCKSNEHKKEKYSIYTNICSIKQFLTKFKRFVRKSSNKENVVTKPKCVNKITCFVMNMLYNSSEGSKSKTRSKSSDTSTHCIGCTLDSLHGKRNKLADKHTSCLLPRCLADNVKLISPFCDSIKNTICSICESIKIIKEDSKCIGVLHSSITEIYKLLICATCALVASALSKAKALYSCLKATVDRQSSNVQNLTAACRNLEYRQNRLGYRSLSYTSSLNHHYTTIDDCSRLMDDIGTLLSDVYQRTRNATIHIDIARKNSHMVSMKRLICQFFSYLSKGCRTEREKLFYHSLWMNCILILLLIVCCIGMTTVPALRILGDLLFYRVLAITTAIVAAVLVLVGLTTFANNPRRGVYLMNVSIVLGILMSIAISWFCQSYAYNWRIKSHFLDYSRQHRVLHPDYIDTTIKHTGLYSQGLRSVVKADFTALWNLFASGSMTYDRSIFSVSLAPKLDLHSVAKLDILRTWPLARINYRIKSYVLRMMKTNISLLFDYCSFALGETKFWNFVTDIPTGSEFVYSRDLLWEAWSRGSVITRGHNLLYMVMLEALNVVSREVMDSFGSGGFKSLCAERVLIGFQKAHLSEMAGKCIDIAYMPNYPRYPQQRNALISLFADQYRSYWSSWSKESSGATTSKEGDEEDEYSIDDVRIGLYNWQVRKKKSCLDDYNDSENCYSIVYLTVTRFQGYLRSLDADKVFTTGAEVIQSFETYCKGLTDEVDDYFIDTPKVTPLMDDHMESQISDNISLDVHSQLRDTLDALSGLTIMENADLDCDRAHERHFLGEWLRLNAINVSSDTVQVMLSASNV
ncbi:putative integral membrane protein [Babesia bovis T2Bo]|uniref:Uncharacterized protein n=1 Tax=Babesia bovis TaxID=5865 RepID=A7ATZ6_BABBO|nr:putative integral membrane protein [Babesia bovis T2Bo]EDO06407.1 putative integral membrane protein [Babesia bovis T2Bo]|eukprot:XP_001609975.1 hypothetical protein [Babesia bovis T2Bo]